MCGIIGYVRRPDIRTRRPARLESLEYGGDDSASIYLTTPQGLNLTRVVGELEHLRAELAADRRRLAATVGVDHTRNGIVENQVELRQARVAHTVITVPRTHPPHHIARRHGLNVDRARNLAKTVTAE
jgi:glucosamine 6-phosphate synthetase-like amidotransferase/phosphosugar isomerase protein